MNHWLRLQRYHRYIHFCSWIRNLSTGGLGILFQMLEQEIERCFFFLFRGDCCWAYGALKWYALFILIHTYPRLSKTLKICLLLEPQVFSLWKSRVYSGIYIYIIYNICLWYVLHILIVQFMCFFLSNICPTVLLSRRSDTIAEWKRTRVSTRGARRWTNLTVEVEKRDLGGGNAHIFYFHPYLGKVSNLTNIFQMGWNHQLEMHLEKKCWNWVGHMFGGGIGWEADTVASSTWTCRGWNMKFCSMSFWFRFFLDVSYTIMFIKHIQNLSGGPWFPSGQYSGDGTHNMAIWGNPGNCPGNQWQDITIAFDAKFNIFTYI